MFVLSHKELLIPFEIIILSGTWFEILKVTHSSTRISEVSLEYSHFSAYSLCLPKVVTLVLLFSISPEGRLTKVLSHNKTEVKASYKDRSS